MECMHSHGDWLAWRWDVPLQLYLIHCNVVYGNYGWGRGSVNGVLIQSLHPDPHLSDQRRIGIEEGLHRGPCFGRPAAPFTPELCFNLTD